MRVFFSPRTRNVGDTLTPILLKLLRPDVRLERVPGGEHHKLVAVGSILDKVRSGDSVWGTGAKLGNEVIAGAKNVQFHAVRGPMTKRIVESYGGSCGSTFGDPGLLVSRFFEPSTEKRFRIGYIPHFVDYAKIGRLIGWKNHRCLIDVFLPLEEFIKRVTECERIISSSLHGIVIAEAFGIPAEWAVYSQKVKGKGFKFRDYFAGTGRQIQKPGYLPPIESLTEIQDDLIHALNDAIESLTCGRPLNGDPDCNPAS